MKNKILISSFSILMITTALLGDKISASDINIEKENTILEEVSGDSYSPFMDGNDLYGINSKIYIILLRKGA